MKTKSFVFTAVIITMFAALFLTACPNPFLYKEKEKEEEPAPYTPSGSAPGTPTGLTTMAASSTSITISWTSVTGATGYRIYRSGTSTGTYTQQGTSTTASYTNTGISASTTYYYKVAAYNSYGESSQSAYVSQNNGSAPLTAPTGIITTTATYNSVSLSWNLVTGAAGYRIYRSTSSTGTYTYVGSSTTTFFTNTGLSLSTTYYYKVAAYNSSGTGPLSTASVYQTTQASSTYTISISGTPQTGQKLSVLTGGAGWTDNNIFWGYATSGNASQFTFFASSYGNPTSYGEQFTIPSGFTGYYIRAFRRHPSGTWEENVSPYYREFPSNFIGPIQ